MDQSIVNGHNDKVNNVACLMSRKGRHINYLSLSTFYILHVIPETGSPPSNLGFDLF